MRPALRWSLDIQCLTRLRCDVSRRDNLESKPAIYRRYWCLEIDLVPEGRSKLGLAMADTFSSLNVHIVFSTKNRQPLLVGEIKERFWAFMGGIAKQNEMKPLCIGGVADHVLLLLSLPTTLSVAKKRCSLSKVDPRLGRMKPLPPSGSLVTERSRSVSLMLRKQSPISKIRWSIIGSEVSRKKMSVF
jgi:hypothetical protein